MLLFYFDYLQKFEHSTKTLSATRSEVVTVSILGARSGAVEHGQTGPVTPDLVNHNSQTMAHSDTVLCATSTRLNCSTGF